jgi:predicted HTH transcriptional regulator
MDIVEEAYELIAENGDMSVEEVMKHFNISETKAKDVLYELERDYFDDDPCGEKQYWDNVYTCAERFSGDYHD